jgi:hypothetical protein
MRKAAPASIGLSLVLLLLVVPAALAHGGSGEEGIEVEPTSITAGQTVILAGQGLEPDSDRVLVLVGGDLTVSFGTVTTDADGGFSQELTIPSHLPSGTYELQAIGDETLTTPLAVTAAAGGAAASPEANDQNETVVARERTPLDLVLILGFVAVAAVVGGLLVWQAERLRGTSTA